MVFQTLNYLVTSIQSYLACGLFSLWRWWRGPYRAWLVARSASNVSLLPTYHLSTALSYTEEVFATMYVMHVHVLAIDESNLLLVSSEALSKPWSEANHNRSHVF